MFRYRKREKIVTIKEYTFIGLLDFYARCTGGGDNNHLLLENFSRSIKLNLLRKENRTTMMNMFWIQLVF
jgi:hypothetical protein